MAPATASPPTNPSLLAVMFAGRHLGQREQYMPTSRGFDYYLGIPFSADMGVSPWRPSAANAGDAGVLPLVEGTSTAGFKIIEQPCALENRTTRYVTAATRFMGEQVSTGSAATDRPPAQRWLQCPRLARPHTPHTHS